MHKKVTAILVAMSMVMSSATVVMAGVTDNSASDKDTESAAAVEESTPSEVTDAEGSSDAEETAADKDKVDFRALVEALVTEIEEAAADVDLEEKDSASGKDFSEEGTVFSLLKDVLADVNQRKPEEDETLKKAIEALSSLEEAVDSELDDLLDMALLGIISGEVDEDLDEGSLPDNLEIANAVASFAYETAKENKQITEAVKATGSQLFEILVNGSKKLKEYVNDDGTMDVLGDIPEEPFESFEEELAKVTDYINKQDGPKQAALDILDLLHKIVDEIHFSIHGHTHEALEASTENSQTENQRPEEQLEVMLPMNQYELINSVEVNGRQGVCSEGDYYWVSGSTTLSKYDKDWNLIATNDDPFKGYTLEVNHIADIDVYNNELYIGAEYFMDGVGKNIQIAIYDSDTLELKRTFPFESESGQLECSGIAVDPDTKTVWMCSWVGEESGRYLYKYDLETGKYLGKVHMQMPPQWLQGIAYYDGWFYMTADDGTADDNEPDHLYRTRIEDGASSCIVTLERTFDDVTKQGEIEGLTFDKDLDQLLLLYNRGARIILGMPKGFYDGYDKEISEVFTYQLSAE